MRNAATKKTAHRMFFPHKSCYFFHFRGFSRLLHRGREFAKKRFFAVREPRASRCDATWKERKEKKRKTILKMQSSRREGLFSLHIGAINSVHTGRKYRSGEARLKATECCVRRRTREVGETINHDYHGFPLPCSLVSSLAMPFWCGVPDRFDPMLRWLMMWLSLEPSTGGSKEDCDLDVAKVKEVMSGAHE